MNYEAVLYDTDGCDHVLKYVNKFELDSLFKAYENNWAFFGCGICIKMADVKLIRYKEVE